MAILIPCLAQLRREVDAIAPDRDRRSDGTIGDPAHRQTVSDHNPDETGKVPIRDADRVNEIHALDVDVDLGPDVTMTRIVNHIVSRCRTGAERRLRYVIFSRTIWHVDNGWMPAPYTGSNPHTGHAHFSASYDSYHEASTASWGLETLIMLTEKDWARLETLIETKIKAHTGPAVWNHHEPNPEDIVDGAQRPGRMGGWARMANKRASDRHTELLARIDEAMGYLRGESGTPEDASPS